jgi:hypothetical protein
MPRALKAFSQVEPRSLQITAPKSHQFTLDLAGLNLSEDQIAQVRNEAAKAAMLAAAGLIAKSGGRPNLDDFGTFSTFSTFSTFGSGAAFGGRPVDVTEAAEIAQPVIGRVVRTGP